MSVQVTVSNMLVVRGLPRGIARAAVQDLTLDNPEYVNREKRGLWLGETASTLCLAQEYSDALVLPRGYLERLLARLKSAGLEYEVDDQRLVRPIVDEGKRRSPQSPAKLRKGNLIPLDDFDGVLERSGGFVFCGRFREYQARALETMRRYGSGVLVAPCGSGKTVLGLGLIVLRRQPALILVHTKDLLNQTREAVRQWLDIEPGIVGDGAYSLAPVTVATVQSLHARPEYLDEAKGRFGLVLLDEAHHAPAATFTAVVQAFPAAFRYGLTATPERRDGLFPFLEAAIGPARHEITSEDLRRAGVLVIPRIEYVRTDFSCPCSEWVDIIDALTTDEARNALALGVIERALAAGRQVLALTERVAHAQRLAVRMEQRFPGAVALAVGTLRKKAREEAIERMRSGEARVLFATKLADEGLNIPGLDALVLLTPSRDGVRTTQRAGRTLRAVPGKPQPVIYDLADCRMGLLCSQARTRFFECYRKLAPGTRLPEWLEKNFRMAG
jgi:hypothetical protein